MKETLEMVEGIARIITKLIDHIAVLRARARWERAARRALKYGTSYAAETAIRQAEMYDEKAG